MIKKIKNFFTDVPMWLNIVNLICVIVWTWFNCYMVTAFSGLVSDIGNGSANLIKSALFFIGFIIAWEIVEFISDVLINISCTHIENNVYKKYISELYVTNPSILKKKSTGYIAGLLNKLTYKKEDAYMHFVVFGIIGVFYVGYVCWYASTFSWVFCVTILGMVAIALFLRILGIIVSRKYIDTLNECEAERTKTFMDAATNITTVQKLRSVDFINKKISEINKRCMKATKKWSYWDEFFMCTYKGLMYLIGPVCILEIVLLKNDAIDMLEFVSFLSIIEIQLVHTAKNIAASIKHIGVWFETQKKVDKIVEDKNERYVSSSIGNNFNTIEIKDAEFSYMKDKHATLIKIPEFTVNKGDCVCVYGESGQGKTTTLNLLTGFIKNDYVYVDGEKTTKNIDAVYISQDVELFDMSLRDNLTLGKNIPDEELISMIKSVGLENWYLKQKEGLDVILGERGAFVSTGQRQRLNLLRGLLISDKEIYLLDEPTSNVDGDTEEKMVKLIEEKLKDKTVIIVTHRDRIKSICNKTYKFENSICTLC